MPQNNVLLLWLEGPLQSWGASSKFSRRSSLDFPTKSGVLGLLLSALGADGAQEALLARFAPLPQTVIAYARSGLREQPLQLCDFHMVGSGYDEKDPWQKLHIPKKSDGTSAVGGGTKMTYRYYIQDGAFAVMLAIPPDFAPELEKALLYPCWDSSLGRRSCAPVEFIFQGLHADEAEALRQAELLAKNKDREEAFRVCEGSHPGEEFVLADVPLCFGRVKRYAERRVTIISGS
jgi:CRISPR system Cascade subunit CasD